MEFVLAVVAIGVLFALAWKYFGVPKSEPQKKAPQASAVVKAASPDWTVDSLAAHLLRKYPNDVPAEVLIRRSDEAGLRGEDVSRAYDMLQYARDNPVKVDTIVPSELRTLDLRGIPSVRIRVKGIANWVDWDERREFGGVGYLLVREPANPYDPNAVAVYGNGRKVGYVSAKRASILAPVLDALPYDAFTVAGAAPNDHSAGMWVDLPKAAELRAFVKTL